MIEIIKLILNRLGITGCLILILLSVIGFDQYRVQDEKAQIITLQGQIKTQNTAITAMGIQRDDLLLKIKNAAIQNSNLTSEFDAFKDKINRQPIATTCDGAMDEVKESAKKNADIWNLKVDVTHE